MQRTPITSCCNYCGSHGHLVVTREYIFITRSSRYRKISGTVLDQQGAVVPTASISAKNVEAGAERSVISDGSCRFRMVSDSKVGTADGGILETGPGDAKEID